MSDASIAFLDSLAARSVPRCVYAITKELRSNFPDVNIMTNYMHKDSFAFLPDGSIFYFSDYLEYNK